MKYLYNKIADIDVANTATTTIPTIIEVDWLSVSLALISVFLSAEEFSSLLGSSGDVLRMFSNAVVIVVILSPSPSKVVPSCPVPIKY